MLSKDLNYFSSLNKIRKIDLESANQQLKEFIETENKTRNQFLEIITTNGLKEMEIDSSMLGCSRKSFMELALDSLETNRINLNIYKNDKIILDYLRKERKYFLDFIDVMKSLSPLEKIVIGEDQEIEDLSIDLLVNFSETESNEK
ncbi:hypothetical protein M0811_06106 [Anaeramoeba ignava]|uniref:EAL domain-containing protein n=1 Tax=Anaeramoeba ignava TaxID=1746090 RepID=A0A9Q0RDE8_ANAIG|nr:hypothetical protein M0811_06106 [Anaeramoeba ignava]